MTEIADEVRISGGRDSDMQREELMTVLSVFLIRTGEPSEVKKMPLQGLIERFVATHGFAR